MTNVESILQKARSLSNSDQHTHLLPNWVRDRILGLEHYPGDDELWDISEIIISEAMVEHSEARKMYTLSVLQSSGGSLPLEIEHCSGKYLRPNEPGAIVFSGPETTRMQGTGPYHSIILNIKIDRLRDRMTDLLDGREPALDPLFSTSFFDPDVAIFMKALVSSYRQGQWTGRRMQTEDMIDGICKRLMTVARIKSPSNKPQKLTSASMRRVLEYMHEHLEKDLSRDVLAKIAGIGPQYFTAAFRKHMGFNPKQYLLELRIERSKKLLLQKSSLLSLEEIAAECGFYSSSHLGHEFKRQVGTSPGTYRRFA